MKCEQATRQLRKDFINKVHRHQTDPYYAHLLSCSSCRQQQEYLQQMYVLFQDVPKERLPGVLLSELNICIGENAASKKQRKKRPFGIFLWPTVVTCCLVLLVFYLKKSSPLVQVQEKISSASSKLTHTVSKWIDRASDRIEDVEHLVMDGLDSSDDAVVQTESGEMPPPSQDSFDPISKNLEQSINSKLNPKAMRQNQVAQALENDNALPNENDLLDKSIDKTKSGDVEHGELLNQGMTELDQLLVQQKQQREIENDEKPTAHNQQLDKKKNTPAVKNVENAGTKIDVEDDSMALKSPELQPPVDSHPPAAPSENEGEELQSCAFATKSGGYDMTGFAESTMMSVATALPSVATQNNLVPSTVRQFHLMNWGEQEISVMAGVALSPSSPNDSMMVVDVMNQKSETDFLRTLKSRLSLSSDNDDDSMQLTLTHHREMEDIELQELLQELDSEDVTDQSVVDQTVDEQIALQEFLARPMMKVDELPADQYKYNLQYCEEDPEITNERQYSFNE